MALQIEYSTRFIRTFGKLGVDLQEEVIEKVEALKDTRNHKRLKVHKLGGKLKGIWSFSINYRIRVTFFKPKKNVIVLETVGTHDEVY
jgi:mRNA-degrading endonuclease YafQ of YafQ-DinJ toxin-antitoxin module